MKKSPKQSAGCLMYRKPGDQIEVFLVHPGGPYWSKKDQGAWTLPKGEFESTEEPLTAARREFKEETGFEVTGHLLDLGCIQQKSGKVVHAWAFEGDCDPAQLVSNTCEIEWPPRSRTLITIPEVDRGAWFGLEGAEIFIREDQRPLLKRLQQQLTCQSK